MNKTVVVSPKTLQGSVVVPPSKSAAHRAVLCAALCDGKSSISNIYKSEDISATIGAVEALGASVYTDGNRIIVSGIKKEKLNETNIFCNESGSTLRFIIPIALAIGGNFTVSGKGRLMDRPLCDYFNIFDKIGITYKKQGDKIQFDGKLNGGEYKLSGNVSSQYITGLLFALSILDEDSTILITTPVESVGYIDMTIDMMKNFGVSVEKSEDYRKFFIKGGQKYRPCNLSVEGDYSQGAFFFAANEMGSNIKISGLSEKTAQGDKEIINIIKKMNDDKKEREIDVSQVPDLVPILTVLAAKSKGITRITGAARLRIKESDRLSAITEELTKLGAKINEFDDSLEVFGGCDFCGGEVYSHNDHRIAMSLAIAATTASGDVTIHGADSVKKSYGDFWEKFKELGGVIK